jgi:transposase
VALIAQDGVDLTPAESTELSHRAFGHRGNRADSKRALAIILLAAGDSYTEIQKAIGCSSQFVARWKSRFLAERLAGLDPVEPEGRRGKRQGSRITSQQESRVLAKSRETPPDGESHWTPDSLGRALRLDPRRVEQIWQAAGIDPKRVTCFRDATDARFEEKAADLIGLYVQGPQRVAVFALEDVSAAKAAYRNGNGIGSENGNVYAALKANGKSNGQSLTRNGVIRNGANGNGHGAGAADDLSSSGSLSLYAMLNTPRGAMPKASSSSDKKTSVAGFIEAVLKKGPSKRAIHVFVEGLDDKRAADIRAAFRRRTGVQLHFADSYATWLNQVEIWLAKIDRDFVAGKVLTRHAELRHKVMQSLRATEKRAQGLRWSLAESGGN